MNMERKTAVLFDIGNVFVDWDPRFLYKKHIDDPEELDFFLNEVVTLSWHTEHDRGKPFSEGVKELINRFPDYENLIKMYHSNWFETIGGLISGTVEVLNELAERGHPVYALTNFSAEMWPVFAHKYAFTDVFGGVVVSGEEGLVKPDPRIYHVALSRFNLEPTQTIYVDDRMENVLAAEQLDLIGHHFTGPDSLKQDFQARGLLA